MFLAPHPGFLEYLETLKTWNSTGILFYDMETLENLEFHHKSWNFFLSPLKSIYTQFFTYFQTVD